MPYRYVPVAEIAEQFTSFRVGKELDEKLATPFSKSDSHPAALVTTKFALSKWDLLKACVEREVLLMKRNRFLYIFRTCQVIIHYSAAPVLNVNISIFPDSPLVKMTEEMLSIISI